MRAETNVGILGIGVYLPEEVRTNDWWPKEVVRDWVNRDIQRLASHDDDPPRGGNGPERLVLDALARLANDPFKGAQTRHVLASNVEPSDMEAHAARKAMATAGILPEDVDILLTYSFCPDLLNVPNSSIVHMKLGLGRKCFSTAVEGVCNAFLLQLSLATAMISDGRARTALLVQSSASSRVLPWDEPYSAWFGDGATAVVIGPVSAKRGLIGQAHRTDGSFHRALHTAPANGPWHAGGKLLWQNGDKHAAFSMLLRTPEHARDTTNEALAAAQLSTTDVDFFASHQATTWFREVAQQHSGLNRARSLDTFTRFGSLMAANIPLVLHEAAMTDAVRVDDVVAMHSGGSGITWSSAILRWGR